jgi:hypothetical protein
MLHVRTSALLMVVALTACGGADGTNPVSVLVAPSPTPGPAGATGILQVSPPALTFTTVTSATQNVAVTESNYTGTFAETDTCASIATASTTAASGPQSSFAVVPVAGGSCEITFKDSGNKTVTVSVIVTTSALNVTSTGRGSAQ